MKNRAHLIIFVKQPAMGKVKTRLAADIGTVKATFWYRWQPPLVAQDFQRTLTILEASFYVVRKVAYSILSPTRTKDGMYPNKAMAISGKEWLRLF